MESALGAKPCSLCASQLSRNSMLQALRGLAGPGSQGQVGLSQAGLRWLSGNTAAAKPVESSSSPEPAIYVACVLERLPVLAPETPAWEADYHAKEQASLIGQGLLRDFPDVRHIYRPGTAQEGGQQGKAGAAPVPQQATVLHQPTDSVEDQTGVSKQTCERALKSAIGQQNPVFFIGNAPMAWTPLLPGGGKLFYMLAQVVDDPWGPLRLPKGSPATDYAWMTCQEAAQHMADARMADLLPRMLSS